MRKIFFSFLSVLRTQIYIRIRDISVDIFSQRILNDFLRTRLSRRSIIWLLPHPFPPLLSASCLSFSVFLFVGGRANWRKRGGMSLVIRRRESLVLYKSYNIPYVYLEYVVNSDVECRRHPVPGTLSIFKFTHLQVDMWYMYYVYYVF
jgi:hypothetical protein